MLIYYGPDGSIERNPSQELLKNILSNDESYWKKGSGDSSLHFEDSENRLIFFKDEPYGFFILFHPDYLTPFNPDLENKRIHHNVGGEPMPISTACYVSQEEAEKIIFTYLREGKVLGVELWKELYDIVDYE